MPNQTILLIDYEPRSIERFRQPLTDAGYTVEVATDGLTGIEAFHRLNPDMVLVEAMIPKKHGFEVCQELKRTPHGRRTPVLITTGVYKGRKYRTQALHIYGCDEYIEKPIAPEQLLAVVGKFFGPSSASASASSTASEARTAAPPEPAVIAAGEGAVRASAPVSITHETPAPRPGPPKPNVGSVAKDFTEEEIMARLDAILPGGDFTQGPVDVQPAPVAVVSAPEPVAVAPAAAPMAIEDAAVAEQDPFSQMQAELTAELGSISAALALEPAPVFDPSPSASYSDQAVAPSVLEALPIPEFEAAPVVDPEETAVLPEPDAAPASEPPGQVVTFDAKRARRKKHGKKHQPVASATATPVAPPAPPAIESPAIAAPRAMTAATETETLSLPTGTLVESDLAGAPAKKGVPVWVWAAAAVIALIAIYFTVLRGGPSLSDSSQAPPADGGITTSQPAVADAGATQNAPAESGDAGLVLNSIGALPRKPAAAPPAPAAKKSLGVEPQPATDQPAAEATALREPAQSANLAPSTPGTVSTTPAPAPPQADPSKPAEEVAPPTGSSDDVTGVENIAAAPAQATAPSIAPGTLVDAEELDTAPVGLSRKAPMYSLQARQMRLQGTVVMKVLVNERGTVDEVVIVEGVPGGDLNASAMKAAKSWTYRPATKGGVPVKTWKVEQVAFKM